MLVSGSTGDVCEVGTQHFKTGSHPSKWARPTHSFNKYLLTSTGYHALLQTLEKQWQVKATAPLVYAYTPERKDKKKQETRFKKKFLPLKVQYPLCCPPKWSTGLGLSPLLPSGLSPRLLGHSTDLNFHLSRFIPDRCPTRSSLCSG